MNWMLALCLTFISYYVCAFPKNQTTMNGLRSFKGDTFTPRDMLPIATKLLQKVDEPGSGRGFVSSVRSPEELADKLFEAFFMTTKRIVILKDFDISGIDALQALALSGEIADKEQEEMDPDAMPTAYLRGQFVKFHDKPKESKYTLVTKTVGRKCNEAERRGIALAKKLKKERNLIINKRRRNEKRGKKNDENSNIHSRQEKVNKSYKRKVQPTKRSQKEPAKCRWQYICENATDLDSCRLHTSCGTDNLKVTKDDIVVKNNEDGHSAALVQFRKMLGLSPVDEEVEKILESRNLRLNPANKDAINKVEALSEYFNKIIVMDSYVTVTAKSNIGYIWPNGTYMTINRPIEEDSVKNDADAVGYAAGDYTQLHFDQAVERATGGELAYGGACGRPN
ncbi:unnamed protein product [Euphydryas editha]|uniref:Uncharacterized protein n=1 Tax=Euphydryas editha TaxID=104508 RepID=A0AAU9V2U7_EUPED|nr:unnamed protein product [Euphydryas editha]